MHRNFLENAENCEELALNTSGPHRKRLRRLAAGWHAMAETQAWLDGRIAPVRIRASTKPSDQDPRETPLDDPRQKTDWPNTKQTDKPWKGNPEKDQLDPNRPKPDLERWQESNTH